MPTYTKEELEKKLRAKGHRRVKYLGIGRTLAVFAGSLKMVAPENITPAFRNAERGDWAGVATRLYRLFMDPSLRDRAEGTAVMGMGVGTGKILDKAQANPHVELPGGYGLKLW